MKKYFTMISIFVSMFLLTACTNSNSNIKIKDLQKYEQNAKNYTNSLPYFDEKLQKELDNEFNKRYFEPWHIEKFEASLEDITWHFKFVKQNVYGDNHKLLSKEWFKKQISNSNFERYNTFLRKAITVQNSNLRVFPTISKIFYNPKIAGEGFPFDYNQNSGIKINSPLLISHFSKDRAWAFVASSFAKGWIKVQDIAYVDENIIKEFENENYYIAIKDNFPIYKRGIFLEYIKLGTLFPLKNNKAITIGRYANNQGYLRFVNIENIYIEKKPISFDKSNLNRVLNELIEEPYGWGELLNHRDCSALTRDFVAPFGLYLDRNSYGQTFNGKYLDISKLENEKKKEFIIKNGVPFLSLMYLKGHVMLYIGSQDKEPLFFHNVWGVKTEDIFGNESRYILGKALISSLNMGEEIKNFDTSKSLLSRALGLVILTSNKEEEN